MVLFVWGFFNTPCLSCPLMTMLPVKLNSAHHRKQHNCCQAGCLFHSSVGSPAQSLLPAQGTCQGSAQALTDAFKQLLLISSAGNGRCRLAQGKCLLQSAMDATVTATPSTAVKASPVFWSLFCTAHLPLYLMPTLNRSICICLTNGNRKLIKKPLLQQCTPRS